MGTAWLMRSIFGKAMSRPHTDFDAGQCSTHQLRSDANCACSANSVDDAPEIRQLLLADVCDFRLLGQDNVPKGWHLQDSPRHVMVPIDTCVFKRRTAAEQRGLYDPNVRLYCVFLVCGFAVRILRCLKVGFQIHLEGITNRARPTTIGCRVMNV